MKVLVFGAGAIGGYLGGALAASGVDVTFLVRPRIAEKMEQHGLRLTDLEGRDVQIGPPLKYTQDLATCEESFDMVLLTVKCTGIDEAAAELSRILPRTTPVVCFQNGIGSKLIAAVHLGPDRVVGGMVPFNVATLEDGRLHRGTEGKLITEPHPLIEPLMEAWRHFGIPAGTTERFEEIAWSKLVLNLNNAVNALSGITLVEELSQRPYRRVLSACQRELLRAMKAEGIKPARLTPLPMLFIPWILKLPNWLFKIVAKRMLAIDPLARSSMWDDLQRGRQTEIDFLNQAVVDLAQRHGLKAPVNEGIVALIKAAEQNEQSPKMSGEELSARLL
jgi:2-dehydropantoate 2-reductase